MLEKTVKDFQGFSNPFKLCICNGDCAILLKCLLFCTNNFENTLLGDFISTNIELKDCFERENDEMNCGTTNFNLPEVGEFVNMLYFTAHKEVMKDIVDYKAAEPGYGFPFTGDREVKHSHPSFSLSE